MGGRPTKIPKHNECSFCPVSTLHTRQHYVAREATIENDQITHSKSKFVVVGWCNTFRDWTHFSKWTIDTFESDKDPLIENVFQLRKLINGNPVWFPIKNLGGEFAPDLSWSKMLVVYTCTKKDVQIKKKLFLCLRSDIA